MTEPADRTDPAARPRRTVGNMDLQSAGMLELARGVATSGGAAILLWQVLSGQIQDVAQDVDQLRTEMRGMSVDLASIRGDIIRLQVQAAQTQPQPHP